MSSLAALTHPLDGDEPVPPRPESALTVTVVPDGTKLTLHLDGELDFSTAGTLRSCLDHIDPDIRAVEVDLADLSFMDSTGIGCFVQAKRELEVGFRTFSVVNAPDRVRFIFDLTGLTELLTGT
jgi:anti-sigma B factor antagonist